MNDFIPIRDIFGKCIFSSMVTPDKIATVLPKKPKKKYAEVPLCLMGHETIAKVRSEYFQGVALEDIGAANNLTLDEVGSVIDAMNL